MLLSLDVLFLPSSEVLIVFVSCSQVLNALFDNLLAASHIENRSLAFTFAFERFLPTLAGRKMETEISLIFFDAVIWQYYECSRWIMNSR